MLAGLIRQAEEESSIGFCFDEVTRTTGKASCWKSGGIDRMGIPAKYHRKNLKRISRTPTQIPFVRRIPNTLRAENNQMTGFHERAPQLRHLAKCP
jgi:hypothetical protein